VSVIMAMGAAGFAVLMAWLLNRGVALRTDLADGSTEAAQRACSKLARWFFLSGCFWSLLNETLPTRMLFGEKRACDPEVGVVAAAAYSLAACLLIYRGILQVRSLLPRKRAPRRNMDAREPYRAQTDDSAVVHEPALIGLRANVLALVACLLVSGAQFARSYSIRTQVSTFLRTCGDVQTCGCCDRWSLGWH
jgi:hypothetical protein